MIERLEEGEEIRKIRESLSDLLGENYGEPELIDAGAQAYQFVSEWGPARVKRAIRVDKTMPEGLRGKRYAERGCGTKNHVEAISKIRNPEKHNIVGLIDYFKIPGTGLNVSIHPFIEGKTLEEAVLENPLGEEEFNSIFSDVLEGVRHYVSSGQFHRDLNPKNIMVTREGGEKGAQILDFANAKEKSAVRPKVLPTAGRCVVMDPLLAFEGEAVYSEGSELYSIGADMYFSLSGEFPFHSDPDLKTLSDSKGRNLLNKSGEIDKKLYEETLKIAIKNLKGVSRGKKKMIRKLLTIDESSRYRSIEELVGDFDGLTNRGFLSKIGKHWRTMSAAILFAGAPAVTMGLYYINKISDKINGLEAIAQNVDKYRVSAHFDGYELEVRNNLVDMEVKIYGKAGILMGEDSFEEIEIKHPFLRVEREGRIDVYINPQQLPRPDGNINGMPFFEGQVYIEGFKPQNFRTGSLIPDPSQYGMGYPTLGHVRLKIPKDLEDGTYDLIVELYGHDKETPKGTVDARSHLIYDEHGKVISKKRIPLVVGEEGPNYVRNLFLRGPIESFSLGFDEERVVQKSDFRTYLDGNLFHEGSSIGHNALAVPSVNDHGKHILEIELLSEGKLRGYAAFELKMNEYSWWNQSNNGPEFAQKIMDLREARARKK